MVLYLLGRDNVAIKEVKTISSYEIKEDIDFNDSSTIVLANYVHMDDGDFALIKDGAEQAFFGICKEMKPSDSGYKITLKQKENLFDTTIFNDGEGLIQAAGMEDYIAKAIMDNFIASGDALMDMDYIQVTARTHTKVAARVSTIVDAENGVYNLKTFLGNVRQNYGIFLDFTVSNGAINIDITNRTQTVLNIDTKLPEVTDLSETYSVKVLAKLIVKWDTPKELISTDMVTTDFNVRNPGEKVADAVTVYSLKTDLTNKVNLKSRGRITAETGSTSQAVPGMSMSESYSNGFPIPYGNVLNLNGNGQNQIIFGWSGTSGATADIYFRNKRDVAGAEWSPWMKVTATRI